MPGYSKSKGGRVIQAQEARLGKAMKAGRSAVRARASAADLLHADQLEERQAAIGERRRTGGPDLDKKPRKGKRFQVPDLPETDCKD